MLKHVKVPVKYKLRTCSQNRQTHCAIYPKLSRGTRPLFAKC